MVWDKFKKFFAGDSGAPGKAPASESAISWIPADKNPWMVPVLDVRPVTTTMISTSTNPLCASNAISYGRDDGTGFINQHPPVDRTIPASIRFRRDRLLADGALYLPSEMEHKWAIYYHQGKILFIRSWQRQVFATATVKQDQDFVEITEIRGTFVGDKDEDPRLTARTADYLILSHALGIAWPAPLAKGTENDPKAAALWCFSAFGNFAHYATPHEVIGSRPEKPLRSHSLFHIAVARNNIPAVEAQLKSGVPIDLLAADGLSALHWSLACPDNSMSEFLLSKGLTVDVRSDQGATALMTVAQGKDPAKLEWLIAHGGDVNARDTRGFTALHRSAEMGSIPLVNILLAHGADPRIEAQGHTAITFAEARGHKAVVTLLKHKLT